MHAAFLKQAADGHDCMQHSCGSNNLVAVTVGRSEVLTLTDVENASTSKHQRPARDALGKKAPSANACNPYSFAPAVNGVMVGLASKREVHFLPPKTRGW